MTDCNWFSQLGTCSHQTHVSHASKATTIYLVKSYICLLA